MRITIYKITTGEIVRCGDYTEAGIPFQINDGEAYIEGNYSDVLYHIVDGQPVLLPEQPGEYYNFNHTTGSWQPNEYVAKGSVLMRRNELLQESDWTDTYSAPQRLGTELYTSWQTYRQALRDVTAQSGYPFNVQWPIKPQ